MKSPNELSFLPDDYLEKKARRRANALCAGLSIVVMAAIGTAFSVTERSIRNVEKRHNEVERAYTDAARRIDQANRMRSQQQKIVHHAELAATLVEKVPRSNLLAEFTNALPAGLSLLDLTLDSKLRAKPAINKDLTAFERKKAAMEKKKNPKPQDEQKAEPKVYDVQLKLTGIADTDVQVAQFISRLNQSKLLKDVNLVISDVYQHGEVTMRRFQIEMLLNPSAEVRDEPVPMKTAAVPLEK